MGGQTRLACFDSRGRNEDLRGSRGSLYLGPKQVPRGSCCDVDDPNLASTVVTVSSGTSDVVASIPASWLLATKTLKAGKEPITSGCIDRPASCATV